MISTTLGLLSGEAIVCWAVTFALPISQKEVNARKIKAALSRQGLKIEPQYGCFLVIIARQIVFLFRDVNQLLCSNGRLIRREYCLVKNNPNHLDLSRETNC
jgi:hypothetical protein